MDISFYQNPEYQQLSPLYKKSLIGVIEGITQGTQICCSPKLLKLLARDGIYFRHYRKVIIQRSPSKNHKQHCFFISRNKKLIQKLKIFRDDHDYHTKFATFLGYPLCCIKNFLRKNSRIQKNICSQHKHMKFIPHIPCHMQCKKSIRIGRQIKTAIQKVDPGLLHLL